MPRPRFLAVGHNGLRLTSSDGTHWDVQGTGKEGEVYRSSAAGNGHLVAVGSYGGDNIFASSDDPTIWKTSKRDARYSAYLRCVVFGKGLFLAVGGDPGSVGSSNPIVMTSPDGVTWTEPKTFEGKYILRRIAFGNARFVGVGDRGRRSSSEDGLSWKDAPDVKAIDTLVDVAFGNGQFVGVGLHGLRMRTGDGLKWTDRQVGDEGEHINSIVWAGDRFVAIGAGATFVSPDGARWTKHTNANAPLIATFGDGLFLGGNWRGRLLRSTDGIIWTDVYKAPHHVESLTFAG